MPPDGYMAFRLHRVLTGEFIQSVYCPDWYRVERLVQDLEVGSVIPRLELESTDGGRRYYKLFWGDKELKEEDQLVEYVMVHGMPIGTPVDLKVYVGYSPRDG